MMPLNNDELFLLSNCAISAAYLAGHLISNYSQSGVSVQSKTGGDSPASQVVTEVDHLSQELILKFIVPSCEIFNIGLLTEESADNGQRLLKDHFWCIDPLDGTLPFIEQTSGYAVSIALVAHSGMPLIGVIYDPIHQTLYHAIQGKGAFRNGKPWVLEQPSDNDPHCLTVINDRSFIDHEHYDAVIQELHTLARDLGYDGIRTIQHGGAVMNACWVLENNPGCYFKFPKPEAGGGSLWDYAATACLFNEMGAIARDINGHPLDLNHSDSTFMNHRGIVYASNQAIAECIINFYENLR